MSENKKSKEKESLDGKKKATHSQESLQTGTQTPQAPIETHDLGITNAEVLGKFVWLFSRSSPHRRLFLSDLDWFLAPAINLRRYRMFHDGDRPVGAVLWATVNQDVDARLSAEGCKLRPREWNCGERTWIIDVVAPFGGAEDMIKDTITTALAGRTVKLIEYHEGKRSVVELSPKSAEQILEKNKNKA